MDLKTVLTVLDASIVSRAGDHDPELVGGAAADLMSDVLLFAQPNSVLLTGLTHPQVVRTAEMAGILAIVFVRGKSPPPETISLAEEIGIPLLCTPYSMYESCGRLYVEGLVASMPMLPAN